ncbi:MAG TPA: DUF5996 family protein [Microthrixaceae bacterium]|nr:DUF5996 family protein [Microthrixaceae bacterium]
MPRDRIDFGREWPELAVDDWRGTIDTVHMWTQIVGKVRMALEPLVNHWWQVPLYVSARGLTTSLLHAPGVSLEIEFDLVEHRLELRTTSGERREIALVPRTVADFYEATMAALAELGVDVVMLARPVEVPDAIPFPEDTTHHSYDPAAMNQLWRGLLEIDRVLDDFRAKFVGKSSPVHFFWGAFDLAVTRFSGRPAPLHPGGAPNCADWVMHEAYSHEVSSCGYWPGASEEGSFYSYAYPEPEGYAAWAVPKGSYYDAELGEFILPYRAVRTAEDPDELLLEFLQATYVAAADLGGWDRAAFETRRLV